MAKHALSLDVIKTSNKTILRLVDTSIYSTMVPITCPKLYITLPGFNASVLLEEPNITSNFSVNLNACALEIQTDNCDTAPSVLPDGIYVIKYAVSPHDLVYVEYNHLRTTCLRNDYQKILCELDLSDCSPSSEVQKKLDVLKDVDMYIQAAEAKVEVCHNPKKGMQLYTYAKKLLSKVTCESC